MAVTITFNILEPLQSYFLGGYYQRKLIAKVIKEFSRSLSKQKKHQDRQNKNILGVRWDWSRKLRGEKGIRLNYTKQNQLLNEFNTGVSLIGNLWIQKCISNFTNRFHFGYERIVIKKRLSVPMSCLYSRISSVLSHRDSLLK